jgi:pimeloyl-ACP methyl ester carboxylesterase
MSEVALFVHSTGIGPFMWTKLLADLPEGVQPLTPANRGYSLMDMLPRGTPISLADEVAHLKAQIPAGTTGVHLGGHSYGGLAALALAMDPAVPVRSIWLYEPVLFGSLKAELDADPASLPADAAEQVRALFGDPDALLNGTSPACGLRCPRRPRPWPAWWAGRCSRRCASSRKSPRLLATTA